MNDSSNRMILSNRTIQYQQEAETAHVLEIKQMETGKRMASDCHSTIVTVSRGFGASPVNPTHDGERSRVTHYNEAKNAESNIGYSLPRFPRDGSVMQKWLNWC